MTELPPLLVICRGPPQCVGDSPDEGCPWCVRIEVESSLTSLEIDALIAAEMARPPQ
jgi:hypothetical protein